MSHAHRSDDARKAAYEVWRAFIAGAQADYRPRPNEVIQTFNYARTLIRKSTSYVFPGPVRFAIIDDKHRPVENNPVEHLLAHVYADLDLHEFDIAQEEERSIIGDCAEKITWDTQAGKPRIVSVDPASLTIKASPDNPTHAIEITQHYEAPAWALRTYGVESTDPDTVVRVQETWSDHIWTLTAASLGFFKAQPNPYGFQPYLVLPNRPQPRSFWGMSDLEDIKTPSQALNRALGILGTILEFSGSPIAVLEGVAGTEGIRVQPGAKWELPEDSKAYLLDLLAEGGVTHHMNYIDKLMTTLHDISETPRTAFGDTGRAISGAAMEVEIQPMAQKTRRKRAGWDKHYTERNKRILALYEKFGGVPIGKDRTTQTIWPPILPTDESDLVTQQVQLVAQGIRSRHTANKMLGVVDPELELARIAEEQATIDTTQPQEDNHATNENPESGE